ncbi:MAG: hypothetical protein ACSLE6_06040 [Mycobacterium sp.]
MRNCDQWRVAVACTGLVALTVAGCSDVIDGRAGMPTSGPDCYVDCVEPTGETTPSRTTSTPTPTTTRSTPTTTRSAPPTSAAPPAEALPSESGYSFIQTKSGLTRCQISVDEVGCEAPFENSPTVDGSPANGVRVTAGGDLEWILGNLGAIPAVTIDYQTYSAQGWTIVATVDGTTFTNDATGRGVFVSVQRVETF